MSTDATKTRLYILFSATERAVMHSYHLKSNMHSTLLSKSITVGPAPSKCLLHCYIMKHATFSHLIDEYNNHNNKQQEENKRGICTGHPAGMSVWVCQLLLISGTMQREGTFLKTIVAKKGS